MNDGVIHRILCLVVLVQLLGCAATPRDGDIAPLEDLGTGSEVSAPSTVPQPEGDRQAERFSNPGVHALVAEAQHHRERHDYVAAAASLERALRLEPRNAALWYLLAKVRLEEGNAQLAAQLAAKSNSFARKDTMMQAKNWRLMAVARKRVGDHQGARDAERRAAELQDGGL